MGDARKGGVPGAIVYLRVGIARCVFLGSMREVCFSRGRSRSIDMYLVGVTDRVESVQW